MICRNLEAINAALQSQDAVSDYLKCKQLLSFGFARQHSRTMIVERR